MVLAVSWPMIWGWGKTLQTIAYLSAHLEEGQRVLVFVTIKPDFTIWQDEF